MKLLSNLVITAAFVFVSVSCSSDNSDSSKKDSGSTQTQEKAKSDPYNSQQKSSGGTEVTINSYKMSGIEFTLDGKPMSIDGITFTPASQWEDFGPSGMRAASYAYGPLVEASNAAN